MGIGYPIWTKKDEIKDSKKPDIKLNFEKKDKQIPVKLLDRKIDKNRGKKIRKLNRQTRKNPYKRRLL